VLGVTLGALLIFSAAWLGTHVVTETALSLFWNASSGMALLMLGLQASRILTIGGVLLLASALVAGFYPDWLYSILAAGMMFGFIGPGLIFAVHNPPDLGAATIQEDRYVSLDL
jgi:hypothetical protein